MNISAPSFPGLQAIQLESLGRFEASPATFTVTGNRHHRRWDYLYANDHLLLRIAHDGTSYLQVSPPEGILVYRSERLEKGPVFHIWLQPEGEAPFSNFPLPHDAEAPDTTHTCTFHPGEACFTLTRPGWTIETHITVAHDAPVLLARLRIHHNGKVKARLRILPVVRPHVASAVLAPWDVLELYQTCRAGSRPFPCVIAETRSPAGRISERKHAVLMTDLPCTAAEVSLDRFCGRGDFMRPDALNQASLPIPIEAGCDPLKPRGQHAVEAVPPVAALEGFVDFEPDTNREFTLSLACAPVGGHEQQLIDMAASHIGTVAYERGVRALSDTHKAWSRQLVIQTPDQAFDDYVNHWLPAQLHWVSRLDRGWPTGLRGVRDASQDFSGVARLYPRRAASMLGDILACQRTDGWFPRQFSTQGPEGKHDLRDYVDSGCWVFELLIDVLRYGGDYAFLEQTSRWLDEPTPASVRDHAVRLLGYYLSPANRGPHNLVLIRGGDWNDSLNQAGVEGRGESVMVSCHVVHLLDLALRWLTPSTDERALWTEAAGALRTALRTHALNSLGFLNGVYTDNNQWVFSDHDPDGACRRNGPVNSFGLIANIFEPDEIPRVLDQIDQLKGPYGWRLFHPPLTDDSRIAKLGRLGFGDLLPGAGENGTVYNHGSQGFFARALAHVGEGARLWEVIRHILPYDQNIHPVSVARTAPYAIVNHWMEIAGHEGEGGAAFLSGTISTVQRVILDGLLGFHAEPDGVHIRPVIPPTWTNASYRFVFRGATLAVTINRGDSGRIALDGQELPGGVLPYSVIRAETTLALSVTLPSSES